VTRPPGATGSGRPPAGLCDACSHQRLIRTTRGSEFSLCRRSREQPQRFPRYPRVPVTACEGYDRRATEEQDSRTPTEEAAG
jgi:hypothetical protein